MAKEIKKVEDKEEEVVEDVKEEVVEKPVEEEVEAEVKEEVSEEVVEEEDTSEEAELEDKISKLEDKINNIQKVDEVSNSGDDLKKVYRTFDKVVALIGKLEDRITKLESTPAMPKTMKSTLVDKVVEKKSDEPEDISKARKELAEIMSLRESKPEEYAMDINMQDRAFKLHGLISRYEKSVV